MGADLTIERFIDSLSESPAPLMFHTTALSDELHATGCERAIDDFLAFWQSVPGRAGMRPLLVFLFVKYEALQPTAGLGFFKRRQMEGLNREIGRRNKHVHEVLTARGAANGNHEGIVLFVPERLGEVTLQHVESWASEHGQGDLLDDVRALFQARARSAGDGQPAHQLRLPMKLIANEIIALMTARDEVRGEVA
jgi:hypothetical protein